MKALKFFTATIFLVIVYLSAIFAQQDVKIAIGDIIPNNRIAGHVLGLSRTEYDKYKVIVYIHTDRWYIHPYAGQGEGQSWASIQQDGTWQIQTVQRSFRSDSVAALLVQRDYREPSRIENLDGIHAYAKVIRKLENTPDYGKL